MESAKEIQSLIEEYPYYSLLYYQYARCFAKGNTEEYRKAIKLATIYAPNRRKLQEFVESPTDYRKQVVAHPDWFIEEEKTVVNVTTEENEQDIIEEVFEISIQDPVSIPSKEKERAEVENIVELTHWTQEKELDTISVSKQEIDDLRQQIVKAQQEARLALFNAQKAKEENVEAEMQKTIEKTEQQPIEEIKEVEKVAVVEEIKEVEKEEIIEEIKEVEKVDVVEETLVVEKEEIKEVETHTTDHSIDEKISEFIAKVIHTETVAGEQPIEEETSKIDTLTLTFENTEKNILDEINEVSDNVYKKPRNYQIKDWFEEEYAAVQKSKTEVETKAEAIITFLDTVKSEEETENKTTSEMIVETENKVLEEVTQQKLDTWLDELLLMKPITVKSVEVTKTAETEAKEGITEMVAENNIVDEKTEIVEEKKEIVEKVTETKDKKQSHADIIEQFLKNQPKISRPKLDEEEKTTKQEQSTVQKEAQTAVETDDFASETLAKVFSLQKQYARAIRIYEKLTTKFPDKTEYYQNLITELKQKLEA